MKLTLLFKSAIISLLFALSSAFAKDTPPNIILVLADDLGYGEIGSFGQTMIQTPNLDRMAEGGIRFTDHYSGATVCAPSRCSLLTGLHTGHARIRGNGSYPLRPEDHTFAKQLKKAGYRTAIIGKWDSGNVGSSGEPQKQGFDYSYGYMHQIDAHNFYPSHLWRNGKKEMLKNKVQIADRGYSKGKGTYTLPEDRKEYSHDLLVEDSLRWIEENSEGPFMLYLSVTIPHANNEFWFTGTEHGMEVPDLGPYENKDWPLVQKAHASMVTRMDAGIGQIIALLEELEIDDNTLIIFTSDNGPHEEGGNQKEFFDTNGPLQGMKRHLYEGGIRVPFVAYWPGTIAPGRTSDHISAFWDYLPTFSEIAGVEIPEKTNGISFLPELKGKMQPRHEYLYWEFLEREGAQAVRWGKWKAVRNGVNGYGFEAAIEIYDLENDIGETRNLAYDRPDLVAKAKTLLENARVPSDRFKFQFEQ